MKRIAILDICNYRDYPTGGQLYLLKNLLSVPDKEMKIYLIGMTTENNEKPGRIYKRKLGGNEYDFIPVFRFSKEKKALIPFRLKMYLGLRKYLKNILKLDIDTVYFHSVELALPFYKYKNSLRLVYHVHGTPDTTLKFSRFVWARSNLFTACYKRLINKAIIQADKVIWASDCGKSHYIQNYGIDFPDKYITIHSSAEINNKCETASRGEFKFDRTKKYLLYAGRLSKVKNVDFLINVLCSLKNTVGNIELIICGEGEEKSRLESYTASMKMCEYVHFMGNVPKKDLAHYYRNADSFVFASESEALSLVVLESLAAGLPVVSSDAGDIKYVVINDITGELVRQKSVENFSNAVLKILNNGKGYYKDNLNDIIREYSNEKMANRIYGLLKSL